MSTSSGLSVAEPPPPSLTRLKLTGRADAPFERDQSAELMGRQFLGERSLGGYAVKLDDMIIASVDDHIIEPPTMFDQHLSAEHRKLAPRYVTDASGDAYWHWEHEGLKTYNVGLNAVVGRPREEYGMEPANIDQMRPGTWDPDLHIDDMNVAGILTSVNFPTFPSFSGKWF